MVTVWPEPCCGHKTGSFLTTEYARFGIFFRKNGSYSYADHEITLFNLECAVISTLQKSLSLHGIGC